MGTSNLRESLLNEINNNETRAIGDLKDSLSRRRVSGSSFAADTLARATKEFNQQRTKAESEIGLIELQAQQDLIQAEHTSRANAYNIALQELNLQGDVAIKLGTQGQATMSGLAQLQSDLLAQNAAGVGGLFQPLVDAVGKGVTSGIKRLIP